jgi:hypothetical protein
LAQARRAGRWPDSYDRLWQGLVERQGRQAGTKAMIELLQLGRRCGQQRLQQAIDAALALGCGDAAAVRHLLALPSLAHPTPPSLETGPLERFDRSLPSADRYDQLLGSPADTSARDPVPLLVAGGAR